jgi:hypothetical protein
MDGQWHSYRILALLSELFFPFCLLDCLQEDLRIPAIRQSGGVSFKEYRGCSRSKSHLIKIDPTFISSNKSKLKLSLEYP